MPTLARSALAVVAASAWLGIVAAAERRSWTVARAGVAFEMDGADLRAWTGDKAGPPVLSVAAMLAADKERFNGYAKEMAAELEGPDPPTYGDYTIAQSSTIEVLSVVGTLVSLRESGTNDTPGAAHPTHYD